MHFKQTARGRELAAYLMNSRIATGWNQEKFAQRLGWPIEKCAQMETGEWSPSDRDVSRFLTECGVPGSQRAATLDLVDGDRDGVWVRPHGDRLPEGAPGVLFQHETANSITWYDPVGIPPILMNSEAIDEDLRHRFGAEDLIGKHQGARLRHHFVLSRTPQPEVTCYLHETGLRSTMAPLPWDTQWGMYHDLSVSIESRQAAVRLIPAERESHIRLPGFSLLGFDTAEPVVCRPCETVTLLLEGDHVATYQSMLARLNELSLSPLESRDLIVNIAGGQKVMGTPPTSLFDDNDHTDHPWAGFITEAMAATDAQRAAVAAQVGG